MARYDGSIKINTEIESKKASVEFNALQNRITKTADKIASLRSKMDSLKDAKIPTQEYKEISAQIEKAEQKFNKLLEEQEQMQREGKDNGVAWQRLNDQIDEVGNEIRYAKGELQDLVDTGKAFTLGSDTEEFSKLSQQLQYTQVDMDVLLQKEELHNLKLEETKKKYKNLGNTAQYAFNTIGGYIKKANTYVNSFGKKIKEIAQKHLPLFRKEAEKTNTAISKFGTRLKSLLSGIFIFNVISAGIRKAFSGINEGFENFYNQNNRFKSAVDSMNSGLMQLKNAFSAAFAPIVQVAIPYIEKIISYLAKAANSVAQLIAALTGSKTYTKALKVSSGAIEKDANALEDVKESAEEAKEALDGYLSPLDEINKYNTDKETKVNVEVETPDVSGAGDVIEDMFEEVPLDSYFQDLADKIKNVFSQLFAPLKEAWNREGKFVINSWKYALDEIWALIKSIGSDFLEVWQQEKTIKIFEDILHIIVDIGLVVGNLAHNFRAAWEENETGKKILEGIRDIIGVIVANIRHAADATVKWSKNLDFAPLLTKVQEWIESLIPVFDNLSGIITDFYEKVLLPLGKWTIEKGLPDLLQVFIDFNDKVDWQALRDRLAEFWEHLEPFAETVGEGLIIFIERCANALANFINSPVFDNFLTMIENWMDNVNPKDVADALENIAKAIVTLKVAVVGFSAISKGLTALSNLVNILKFFGAGGGAGSALSVLKSIGTTIAGWAPHIAAGIAIVDVLKRIKEAVSERIDTSGFGLTDWISETLKLSLEGWKSEFENFKISLELWWQDTWMSDVIWKFGQWWDEKVAPWFTQEKWQELFDNIKQALSDKWNEIAEWWSGTAIVSWWNEHVAPWFTKEKWQETFNNIKEALKEIWDNTVGQWSDDVSAWWDNDVAPWFTKEKWKEVLSSLPDAFRDTFSKVGDSVKEKINEIVVWVKEKVDWLKEKINSIKESFNSIKSWSSSLFSGSIFSSSSLLTTTRTVRIASPAVAALSNVEIPGYATGQVIPRTMKKHLAYLGDNDRETEVVSPLSTIKQALREEAMSLGLGGASGNGNLTLKVYLEDSQLFNSKKIFEAVIKEGKVQQMSTGKNRLLLES